MAGSVCSRRWKLSYTVGFYSLSQVTDVVKGLGQVLLLGPCRGRGEESLLLEPGVLVGPYKYYGGKMQKSHCTHGNNYF